MPLIFEIHLRLWLYSVSSWPQSIKVYVVSLPSYCHWPFNVSLLKERYLEIVCIRKEELKLFNDIEGFWALTEGLRWLLINETSDNSQMVYSQWVNYHMIKWHIDSGRSWYWIFTWDIFINIDKDFNDLGPFVDTLCTDTLETH